MLHDDAPEVWPELSAVTREDRRVVFAVAFPRFDGAAVDVRATVRTAHGFEVGFVPRDLEPSEGGRSAEVAFALAGDAPRACIPFELTWDAPLDLGTRSAALLMLELRLGTSRRVFEVPVVVSVAAARGPVRGAVTEALCRSVAAGLLRGLREAAPSAALLERVHGVIGFVEARAGLAGMDATDVLAALGEARDALAWALEPRDVEVLRCWVAGTRFYEDAVFDERILAGSAVRLEREPENPHDARAIAVRTLAGAKLGYVPRADNEVLANLMDAGVALRGAILRLGRDTWRHLEMGVSMRAPSAPRWRGRECGHELGRADLGDDDDGEA